MRLDRNITTPRRGKYALIKLRPSVQFGIEVPTFLEPDCPAGGKGATYVPVAQEAIDFGDTDDSDFFVIRLKDKYAAKALKAYAEAAASDDPEYADEVYALARAASEHPSKRKPD